MNEKDWDAVAERFEEEIFNVPANDKRVARVSVVESLCARLEQALDG